MLKSIGIGAELFHELIESNSYYVDDSVYILQLSVEGGWFSLYVL